MLARRLLVTVAVVAVLGSACSAGSDTSSGEGVTGVVVAVDGDLAAIDSFSVLVEDGSTVLFVPDEGLLFDGSGPLSHLRDHLVSGVPVAVEFRNEGSTMVATAVGDAE